MQARRSERGIRPMRKLRRLASRLGSRLRSRAVEHRPSFDEAAFLAALATPASGDLRLACAAADESARATVIDAFFRDRPGSRFCFEPCDLPAMLERLQARHADWVQAALARHRIEFDTGYQVFGRTEPPLRPGFPWGGIAPGPGGDRLYSKQVHRFAFAPAAAKAALIENRPATELIVLLQDWMNFAARPGNGLAYDSNLTVIQRLLALSWVWQLLGGRSGGERASYADEQYLVLRMIAADVHYLEPRLGDAYPNNHLLADCFAGWFIRLLWPEFARGPRSLDDCEQSWFEQVQRQLLADGSSFEHSTHYHEYACEMLVSYLLLSEANGRTVPAWLRERSGRALRLQADLAGPEAHSLSIGDAVEDMLLPLDAGRGWAAGAWRELGTQLFGWQLPPAAAEQAAGEKAFWLLGARPRRESVAAPPAGLCAYPDGGYYICNHGPGATRLIFRSGPAPGREIAAGHAHADLLSVYASVDGQALIGASGTGSYRFGLDDDPRPVNWRRYFMGPLAHNTLIARGADPLGELQADFRPADLPVRVAVAALGGDGPLSLLSGTLRGGAQDGRQRGVLDIREQYWLVFDLPARTQPAACEVRFQLTPGVTVTGDGDRGGLCASAGGASLSIAATTAPARVLSGDRDSLGGWVAPRYGLREAAPQLVYDLAAGATVAGFVLAPGRTQPLTVESLALDGGWLGFAIEMHGYRDLVLINQRTAPASIEFAGVVFSGRVLWLRQRGERPCAARWLDGQSLRSGELQLRAAGTAAWLDFELDARPALKHDPACAVRLQSSPAPDAGGPPR